MESLTKKFLDSLSLDSLAEVGVYIEEALKKAKEKTCSKSGGCEVCKCYDLDYVNIVSVCGNVVNVPKSCMSGYLQDSLSDILLEEKLVKENNTRSQVDAELFLKTNSIEAATKLPLEKYYVIPTNVAISVANSTDEILIDYLPVLYANTAVGKVEMGKSPRSFRIATRDRLPRGTSLQDITLDFLTVNIVVGDDAEYCYEYSYSVSYSKGFITKASGIRNYEALERSCFKIPEKIKE